MTTSQNGYVNGASSLNGHANGASHYESLRFTDIPPAIDIPVSGGDAEEAVELNLEELLDDPTELCTLLENENVAKSYWMVIALAYAKQRKVDHAIDTLNRAVNANGRRADEKLSLLSCICWLYLLKCREAPRLKPEGESFSDVRTKEQFLHLATQTLNDASRISPAHPPLFLARGVLYLLRASLQPPAKGGPSGQDLSDRADTLRQALKCFEDALRTSNGKNMMAVLGKARAQFSLGKLPEALQGYQHVLERNPDLVDPDPRIGIGCCFWQLGYKDDAKSAWQRSLELNPDSKIANILMGIYHLHQSSQYSTTDPLFAPIYKKAMTQYTQKAFKLDDQLPLTCATFGGYFLMRKVMAHVERLARRAIELTDVNAIASDGWYLLARKEHYEENVAKAAEYYMKADQARGGDERGYLPAKFGVAQLKVLQQDLDDAKFRLEKVVQHSKTTEAMTVLGTLYAEDVFAAQAAGNKDDKSNEMKKAISYLEQVRAVWKDAKKKTTPDSSVLLNLARLYEVDHPEKSLQCLQQVEQMELDEIPEEDRPEDVEDEAVLKALLRENLPPQLLNNMGCFHYQAERYLQARDFFQTALNACVKVGDKHAAVDTDALVTTISYNLARTYEAEGSLDEAKKVYHGLLERHSDYTDANIRLAYIALRQNPADEGPKTIQALYQAESNNIEVRTLYGWYLSRAKKRTLNINEDQEQRHYKHTLQNYDKHDRYALTGMGNLYLITAREMPRNTDQEKEKRRRTYERAIEFFDKALQLDPKNAYAAQGIAIAMIEDKKDVSAAIQIFSKVKETMKDASVFINLGHAYCDMKQYSRAIENYETALAKDRARDPHILTCLGRVWLMKGKQEQNFQAMKTSLEYSQRALEVAPEQIYLKFNVAFVQIQIAQQMYSLPEAQRTLEDVQAASQGLDEAIDSFSAIAKSPNPPFPKNDIEQRVNMGRNTMRKRLDRAIQSQKEYEEKNAARLQHARELREAEIKRREEEKRKAEEALTEQRRKIAEERQKMAERDAEIAARRAEEEKRREDADMTTDDETGEKVKRTKRKAAGGKRKKKGEESDTDGADGTDGEATGASKRRARRSRTTTSAEPGSSGDDKPRKKKKRKLERKAKDSGKYKSAEFIDSDEDLENSTAIRNGDAAAERAATGALDQDMHEEEDGSASSRRKKPARIVDEDDEIEEDVLMDDDPSGGATNEDAE